MTPGSVLRIASIEKSIAEGDLSRAPKDR